MPERKVTSTADGEEDNICEVVMFERQSRVVFRTNVCLSALCLKDSGKHASQRRSTNKSAILAQALFPPQTIMAAFEGDREKELNVTIENPPRQYPPEVAVHRLCLL